VTVLGVFEIMKEMFEALMSHIADGMSSLRQSAEYLQDSRSSLCIQDLEKTIENYKKEVKMQANLLKEQEKYIQELNFKLAGQAKELKDKADRIINMENINSEIEKKRIECEKQVQELKKVVQIAVKGKVKGLLSGSNKPSGGAESGKVEETVLATTMCTPQCKRRSQSPKPNNSTPNVVDNNLFLKGYLNKTSTLGYKKYLHSQEKPSLHRKGSASTTRGGAAQILNSNQSLHDLTNRTIANCMINNLYFLPKHSAS